MISIGPIILSDADEACEFLHQHMNSDISRMTWKNLFKQTWQHSASGLGVVAKSEGKIVGIWPCIYSLKENGQVLGNPSSFYIHKDWRGQSIASKMMDYFLQLKNCHYFLLSVSPKAEEMYQHWGFKVLETHNYVFESKTKRTSDKIVFQTQNFEKALSPKLLKIYEHHKKMNCQAFWVEDQELILVKSFKSKSQRKYSSIIYASGFKSLEQKGIELTSLLTAEADQYLTVDARFFDQNPPGASKEPLPTARYYLSSFFKPREIQLDYSEVALIDVRP